MQTASDSLLQGDLSTRSFQSYSPTTSYSSSGSTYSFSSSPNSTNSYGSNHAIHQHTESESIMQAKNSQRRVSDSSVFQYTHGNQHHQHYLDSSMNDDIDHTSVGDRSFQGYSRPVNRFFPDGVVDILNKWFYENQNYPYPDENMTNFLAKEANISPKQVRKWFANKRVRSNKCYKQTFRIRRVDSTLEQNRGQLNRRQTKSVSEPESLHMQHQSHHYYSSVLNDDNQNRSPESTDRKSYKWPHEQQHHLSSAESSASSSPPGSFASSSPINSHNKFGELDNAHQSATNAFNSMYNPYFLMNFLQMNQSMALQAVLANSILTQNNNDNGQENVATSPTDQTSAKQLQNNIKRKPNPNPLNRFLSDSFKANNLNLIEEVATGGGLVAAPQDDNASNHQKIIGETNSCLRDLLMKPKREGDNSTCSNNKSMRSTFSLDELSTSLNSASMQSYTKTPKKINFGDISSLI